MTNPSKGLEWRQALRAAAEWARDTGLAWARTWGGAKSLSDQAKIEMERAELRLRVLTGPLEVLALLDDLDASQREVEMLRKTVAEVGHRDGTIQRADIVYARGYQAGLAEARAKST